MFIQRYTKSVKGLSALIIVTLLWGTLFAAFTQADAGSSQNESVVIENFEDLADVYKSQAITLADGYTENPADTANRTMLTSNGRPGPVQYGHSSAQLNYDFRNTKATAAAYLNFRNDAGQIGRPLQGYPNKIGIWVYGNGGEHWLRAQLEGSDAALTKYAIDFTGTRGFNWKGWKYVTATVPANITLPIKIRQIYFAETGTSRVNGAVFFDQLSAIYTTADQTALELTGLAGMKTGDMLQAQALATVIGATSLLDVTAGSTFASSDETVAAIDSQGLVTAAGVGTATITAEHAGLKASYELTVGDSPASVESIELEGSVHLETGVSEVVKALAFFEGNTEAVAVTSKASFASSNTEVATVAGNGLVTAVGAGQTVISAEYGNRSFSYTLTVTDPIPVLQSIRLDGLPALNEDEEKQVRVLATYTLLGIPGEELDVTDLAEFESNAPSVATIDAGGLVQAHAVGTAAIKAKFGGRTAEQVLVVVAPQTLPKRELRAAWIASVDNIDWPRKGVTDQEQQKQEFVDLLDGLASTGINAVIVQVKPTADAFYPSQYAPWSEWLTGTQGQDPGYDPLAFMLEEAHKRNMEFHAWFNPYRISLHADLNKLVEDHPAKRHPDWVVEYGGKLYFNPGIPAAKEYVIDSVMEVVNRYDIDAVHFDDYFYPYPTGQDFPDGDAFAEFKGDFTDKNAWRRNNVDMLVEEIAAEIKESKPFVKFGISPFGIWRNKSTDPAGSETSGLQSYDAVFADTKKWVEEGWLDYIAPQIYWNFSLAAAPYAKVLDWWRTLTKDLDIHLYVGHAMYRVTEADWINNQDEIIEQIKYNRSFAQVVHGSMYFSAKSVIANLLGTGTKLKNDSYRYPALAPTMPWLDNTAPQSPVLKSATTSVSGQAVVTWEAAAGDSETAYYAVYRAEGDIAPDIADPAQLLGTVRKQAGATLQSFVDSTIMNGTIYTYAITAVDRLHNESTSSNASRLEQVIINPNPNPNPNPEPSPSPSPSPKPSPEPGPSPTPVPEPQLTDIAGHWAAADIVEGVKLGIVKGYDDNTFRPEKEVSRAEFIALLMRAFPETKGGQNPLVFADMNAIPSWSLQAIEQAVGAGIINGYDDRTFRPRNPITRFEIAAMVVRMAGLEPILDAEPPFSDIDKAPSWSRGYIAAAVQAGHMVGIGQNLFAPAEPATRAEAIKLILSLLKQEK